MAKQTVTAWQPETSILYIKEFQNTVPEEYRIVGGAEMKSARKILTSFYKFPPDKKLRPKVKGLSEKELFFLDLYLFFFVQRMKSFAGLSFYDDEKDEIIEIDNGKKIISYLKTDGVVLAKLKLLVCLYAASNNKLKCYPENRIIENLKQEVLTHKSIYILSKENEL